ncbi:WD40-repeat-containing domain protein, partial [Scleroderma yunnanense]
HLPTRPGDPTPTSRNLDPLMHPFSRSRERMRALNAAKMERMFAKPFIAALGGHIGAVEVLCRKLGTLNTVASGSWDGGILAHNIAERKQVHRIQDAHKGKISDLCFSQGNRLLSCGVDTDIKLWDISLQNPEVKPLDMFSGKSPFNSIDHHRSDPLFVTASNIVQVWNETKTAAISNLTFPTATETVTSVRFNLSETSVLGSIGSDRSFTLDDIRTRKAERRVVMQMRSNALSWSPTLQTLVLLASKDHNLYTFDAHVSAVMSCDWCPTGLEFVSGGWDRTVRIWKEGQGTHPEVYHTKRMQRWVLTHYSYNTRFVVSGSDDGNVRIWKAKAHEKLGVITARERAAIEYRESLKERWKYDQEVGRISRARRLPTAVHQASKLKQTILEAQRVKEERRRKHTRSGHRKPKAERKNVVLTERT